MPVPGAPVPGITVLKKNGQALLTLHYIDVGQGDSILIQAPEGQVAVIDGGEAGSGALAYLQTLGITHVDLMVATHQHTDHIGGLVEILDAISVSEVVTNGQPHTTRSFESFLDGIAAAHAKYREVKRGDSLTLGSLKFAVLNPSSPTGEDLNQQSLVLRLTFGKVAFLFTGDAGEAAEAEMLASGEPLQAQILKVAHHGSHSASSPAFLEAVQPKVAVYSAGAGNSYGHPHAETLAALTAVGAKIYGTDKNGTVEVTSDGIDYTVETGGTAAPRAPPTQTTVKPAGGAGSAVSGISVVSLTSPVTPCSTAHLRIKTTPGASCAITVLYKSGPSEAAGLGPATADASGIVCWDWTVGTRTTPANWLIVVAASAGGKTVTKEIPFNVGG